MTPIKQRQVWLFTLFIAALLSAPLLFIEVYFDIASKIIIALSGIAMSLSLIAMAVNYIPNKRLPAFGVSILTASLTLYWLADAVQGFWPAYLPANFMLVTVSALTLPAGLLIASLVGWHKPMLADHTMALVTLLVVLAFVVFNVINLVPFSASDTETLTYHAFGWMMAIAAVVVLLRNRLADKKTLTSQTTFTIGVLILMAANSLKLLFATPVPEIWLSLSILELLTTLVVVLQVVWVLFWVPARETERQLEAAILKHKQLREVIDQVPAGILWKDTYSRFLGGNRYFLNSLGIDHESDLIGLSEYDLRHGSVDEFLQQDRQVMDTGKPLLESYEQYRLQNNRMTFNRISRSPLRDSVGHIYGIVAIYSEIEQLDGDEKRYRVKPNHPSNIDQFYQDNQVNDLPSSIDSLDNDQETLPSRLPQEPDPQ